MQFIQDYKNKPITPFRYPIDTSLLKNEITQFDDILIQNNIIDIYNIDNDNDINLNDFHNINFHNITLLTDIGLLPNNNKNSIKNEIQQFY